jgi:hypothetical protein
MPELIRYRDASAPRPMTYPVPGPAHSLTREAHVTQQSGGDADSWINGQVCAMLAVDIAEFSRPDRDEEIQLHLRTSFYGVVREALCGSGMPWDQGQHEDRGDGVLVVFRPGLAAQPLIDSFPERLRDLLRRYNRYSCESARMQLRVAAHIGPVYSDEHGFSGDDVTFLCRMIDIQPLRRALSQSHAEFALVVSDYVYDKLVLRRYSMADPRSFRQVKAQVKRTSVHGWIYLSGRGAALS